MHTLFEIAPESGLAQPPIDTLRVVAMKEPLGYFLGFNERRPWAEEPEGSVWSVGSVGSGSLVRRRAIVAMRELSGDQKILYRGSDSLGTESRIIDLAPAYSSSRAVALGVTSGVDIETRQPFNRYWLLSVGKEGIFGPVEFLDQPRGAWVDPDFPTGPPAPRYEPLRCVGHLDGPGDLVVVAKRRAALPDTIVYSVVALWLRGADFSIRREVVIASEPVGLVPSSYGQVRAWPTLGPIVGSTGGDLHIGIQVGNQVRVFRTSGRESISARRPFHSVNATGEASLEDFRLVGGVVDTRSMESNPSGGVGGQSVGCIVLQEGQGGAGASSQLSVHTYNTGGSFAQRRLPLGTSNGRVTLLREEDTGGRFLLADWDGSRARVRRLGTQGAVCYRASLPLTRSTSRVPPGAPDDDLAMCFHPAFNRAVLAAVALDPSRRGAPWRIAGVDAHRGHTIATPSLDAECASIGLAHHPRGGLTTSPVVGHAPYAGQYFFEIRLIEGPAQMNVWLVVGETPISRSALTPGQPDCQPTLDFLSDSNAVFTAFTDRNGNATLQVPLDDTTLPTIFEPGPDFRARGETLSFPPLVFAQWQWLTGNVDLIIEKDILVRRNWGLIESELESPRFRIRPSTLLVKGSQTLAMLLQG